jgi:RecB family endonuclease NucS
MRPLLLSCHVRGGQYGARAMRLLVARCGALYTGRLTARLPEAVRLLMSRADGSVLVHDDGGGCKPLNCIRRVFRAEEGFRQWAS